MATRFEDYQSKYRCLRMTRTPEGVLTGTGGYWIWKMDFSAVGDIKQPETWPQILTEARRTLYHLLDIGVPVVAVVPGPAHAHGEYALTADVVRAADTATFKDEQHLNIGVMPADGVQVLYAEAMGHQRFRAFELLQQTITAEEALRIGMVNEALHTRGGPLGFNQTIHGDLGFPFADLAADRHA